MLYLRFVDKVDHQETNPPDDEDVVTSQYICPADTLATLSVQKHGGMVLRYMK